MSRNTRHLRQIMPFRRTVRTSLLVGYFLVAMTLGLVGHAAAGEKVVVGDPKGWEYRIGAGQEKTVTALFAPMQLDDTLVGNWLLEEINIFATQIKVVAKNGTQTISYGLLPEKGSNTAWSSGPFHATVENNGASEADLQLVTEKLKSLLAANSTATWWDQYKIIYTPTPLPAPTSVASGDTNTTVKAGAGLAPATVSNLRLLGWVALGLPLVVFLILGIKNLLSGEEEEADAPAGTTQAPADPALAPPAAKPVEPDLADDGSDGEAD